MHTEERSTAGAGAGLAADLAADLAAGLGASSPPCDVVEWWRGGVVAAR